MLGSATTSLDAALYRLNSPKLAAVLFDASRRGVRLRLVLDLGKHQSDAETRRLLEIYQLPFRLLRGRRGADSKMHHKFVILDNRLLLTGSYNWTTESDEENFENLVVLANAGLVQSYREEFEALWNEAGEHSGNSRTSGGESDPRPYGSAGKHPA
ncbi:MAG TPA: phospholipase D-like domain-containing protein [Terriglobia bacterium]|nr:phospholipase D-like domain-containing protein [Terriglobia bacterium]